MVIRYFIENNKKLYPILTYYEYFKKMYSKYSSAHAELEIGLIYNNIVNNGRVYLNSNSYILLQINNSLLKSNITDDNI